MDDGASLVLVLRPPRSSGLCVSSPGKGEDAWGGTRGGKQDERWRRDRKES